MVPRCVLGIVLLCSTLACSDDSSNARATPEAETSATPEKDSGGGVFMVAVDGSSPPVRLAGNDTDSYFGPSWAPSVTVIAVSHGSALVLLDVGAEPRVLLQNERSNYLPAWSPGAVAMVFLSQEGEDTSTAELYRINRDGTDEQRSTQDGFWDYGADWLSEDVIVFGSLRNGVWRIYTIGANGGDATPLLVDALGNAPTVSPDGRSIAFTSDRDGDDDIYVMAADGAGQRNVTANTDHDDNPSWAPDGTRIAFSSDRSGKNEIYVMNIDGTDVRQITDDASLIPDVPSWAPDGERIVFAAQQRN
jgi:Tol biopolymer transport system component